MSTSLAPLQPPPEPLPLATYLYTEASRCRGPSGYDQCDWGTRRADRCLSSVPLVGKLVKCSFISLTLILSLRCLPGLILLLGDTDFILALKEQEINQQSEQNCRDRPETNVTERLKFPVLWRGVAVPGGRDGGLSTGEWSLPSHSMGIRSQITGTAASSWCWRFAAMCPNRKKPRESEQQT